MKEIRTLKASEISCRVNTIDDKGLTLLLYKDARVDMDILDETFGAMNWKKEYSRDNRNCTVSIYDENKKEWVSKEDTGIESNSQPDKGLASDSFKRACVNWGIGRELYTAPFIYIPADKFKLSEKNGKPTTHDKFYVEKIAYTNKEITGLAIKNQKGERVFVYTVKYTGDKNENNK